LKGSKPANVDHGIGPVLSEYEGVLDEIARSLEAQGVIASL